MLRIKQSILALLSFIVLFDAAQVTASTTAFLSVGVNAAQLSNTANVVIDQFGTANSYYTNLQTNWNVATGVSLQTNYHFNHHIDITVGPAFYYTDLGSVRGWEYPDSSGGIFDTLDYRFNAYSNVLLLESRLICEAYAWQPFVVLGVGSAWNSLSNYNEVPTDPNGSATSAPGYKNNTIASVAFEAGAGISHHLFTDEKHAVSYSGALEYRYFNLGAARFAPSSAQTSNSTLRISTLDTHAILATVSATFD